LAGIKSATQLGAVPLHTQSSDYHGQIDLEKVKAVVEVYIYPVNGIQNNRILTEAYDNGEDEEGVGDRNE
jgi:hypothetical protein